jgi:hypothetical protein
MGKFSRFFSQNLLKIGISALLLFIPLYPKLPSLHITHTWVYIRLEDFLIFLVVGIWLLQLILRKVKLPPKIWSAFAFYWIVGFISLVVSLIFIAPHLANFFPSVALLYYVRHVEYLILFFVAFSSVKSFKDLKFYLLILSVGIVAFSIYAFGQRFYIDLWAAFPKFFQNFSYCFPSFQTGNEEFAKGVPLCLPKEARITSTFAGHYDLAAYLALIIPILIGVSFSIKKSAYRIFAFLLSLVSAMVLIFTASRISFIAYLIGVTATLVLLNRKRFILPFYFLSIVLLLIFSGSTAKRFMDTFRITSVVVNNQGQVVGEANLPSDLKKKISDNILENVPSQGLPVGTGYLGLPQIRDLEKTNKAIVQSSLSIEEAKRLKLENGGVEISTISGSFLVKKVLVYDISFTTRFQAEWPNAWSALLRNPILGSGFATITLAADNNYLRILGETGLLGIISFLSIFLVFFLTLKQALPFVKDKIARGFLLGIAGGILALFINAVLIDVFEASKVAETLWILLGIATGTIFLYKKDFSYRKSIEKVLSSNLFIGFYLLFSSLIFFLKSVGNFFVADDFTWLKWAATTNLPDIPKLFTNSQGFFYRPLDKTVMYFLYTFFSFSPQGYHLFFLLTHFLVGIGVYILVNRLFGNKPLSFLAAFIFLFLPSQAENVFWISTMGTTLSAFFIVYMLLFWMNFSKNNSKLNYLLSFLFGLLALLSYEGSIIILPLLVLLDVFIIKRTPNVKNTLKYFPFAFITLAYPVVRQLTHSVSFGGDYSYNFVHLVPNLVGNFLGYLGLYVAGEPFLPIYTIIRNLLKAQTLAVGTGLFIFTVLIAFIIVSRKKIFINFYKSNFGQLIIFSFLFSFISLIPYLGLGNIAQRYSYLASIGFVLLIVVLVKRFTEKIPNKSYIVILIALFLGGFYYYQSNNVNSEWKEAGRITNRTLAYLRLYYDGKHPNSNFYFIDVPIRRKEAWIFPVGLDDGIWFIYRDNSIRTYKLTLISEGKTLAKDKKNFVFSFDKKGNIYSVK